MVGVLWKARRFAAAIRLEEYWNRLLESAPFQLFCGYPIDIFGDDVHAVPVQDVLRTHTHLMSSGENSDLDSAVTRAVDEVFGVGTSDNLKALSNGDGYETVIPKAEAAIFSLSSRVPGCADEVLSRARRHYQGEKRFRALVENSFDAICLVDALGRVQYASPSTT
jgi:PAS domain-containing protein